MSKTGFSSPIVGDFSVPIVERGDTYILNHCTKYLARENVDQRHNFGQFTLEDARGRICESYHFPIIDSFYDGQDQAYSYSFNEVTFVYFDRTGVSRNVSLIGTFAKLYELIPLRPVKFNGEETGYYAVTCVIPKGVSHNYKYLVDGAPLVDPINPQLVNLDNGEVWSRFFTQLCTEPLVLERFELLLLDRLVEHILPFRTADGERFLRFFYNFLDKQAKETQYTHAYRFDQPVGVVNFIDKLLAREEGHNLDDYKICLGQIERILRQRNPYTEPNLMPKEMFIQLYNEMASGAVAGWNYAVYGNPKFFLQLLRRHTFTGAFSHPKYGGNVGGVGWAYLAERFVDDQGKSLFNWRTVLEKPLGINEDYHG
jgi:hypothetical protein